MPPNLYEKCIPSTITVTCNSFSLRGQHFSSHLFREKLNMPSVSAGIFSHINLKAVFQTPNICLLVFPKS